MASVRELLGSAQDLASDSARRDVEILLGYCLDKPRSWLYAWPEKEIDAQATQAFLDLVRQRSAGTPIAYLTGKREFWTLELLVSPATLIPRPETEILVAWALDLPLLGDAAVVDLGTGSGAIALALASERPHWQITAVDVSAQALEVAQLNARSTQLGQVVFLQSHWYQSLPTTQYDALFANPPYIDASDAHLGEGDVRFEPRSALVASDEGLADIAQLVSGASAYLKADGWLLLEHGYQQGPAVRALLNDAGFSQVTTKRDFAENERVTGGCWHAD